MVLQYWVEIWRVQFIKGKILATTCCQQETKLVVAFVPAFETCVRTQACRSWSFLRYGSKTSAAYSICKAVQWLAQHVSKVVTFLPVNILLTTPRECGSVRCWYWRISLSLQHCSPGVILVLYSLVPQLFEGSTPQLFEGSTEPFKSDCGISYHCC